MRDIVRIGRDPPRDRGSGRAVPARGRARPGGGLSAVYRYVASRDDLLTLLVVDAYDELGDAVEAALEKVDGGDHLGRMAAVGHAVRTWGLAEPARTPCCTGARCPATRRRRSGRPGPASASRPGWSRCGRTRGTPAPSWWTRVGWPRAASLATSPVSGGRWG